MGTEAVKLTLFEDNTIVYIENPKYIIKKVLEIINEFSKIAKYKFNREKPLVFLYTNNEKSEILIKEIIIFTNGI